MSQPFKQKAAERKLRVIIPSRHCELTLTGFPLRDWIQRSPWQTAEERMNPHLQHQNQPMESSRWGAAWPRITVRKLLIPNRPLNSWLSFFFFYCDLECRCPCEQPPSGQLSLWGRVQVLHQHQRELAFAERSDGCSRERRPDAGSSGQHRIQASAGHHRTPA